MAGSEPAQNVRLNKEREAKERRLIEAAQSDPARFSDVYENYFGLVYAYVARRVRMMRDATTAHSAIVGRKLPSSRSMSPCVFCRTRRRSRTSSRKSNPRRLPIPFSRSPGCSSKNRSATTFASRCRKARNYFSLAKMERSRPIETGPCGAAAEDRPDHRV